MNRTIFRKSSITALFCCLCILSLWFEECEVKILQGQKSNFEKINVLLKVLLYSELYIYIYIYIYILVLPLARRQICCNELELIVVVGEVRQPSVF